MSVPKPAEPLRIGILSFAHLHAEAYVGNLRAAPGADLVGYWDPDTSRAERVARDFELRRFDALDALLGAVDAVLVCSETARHRRDVERAAAAGCHVLCEKPIATTLADAAAMRAACERTGVHFMTAFPMRFSAPVRALRGELERGALGTVYAVNGINHSEMPRHHRAWFADAVLAGGGAVMDHTVHLADLYRWLLGREATEVYAEVGTPLHSDAVEVDTAGLITVGFDGGVFASIDCSWSRPPSYPRWGHLKLEVFGERGALELDAFARHLRVWSPREARTPAWLDWGSDANQGMIDAFVAAVREDRAPPVTWRDGERALAVALAAYRSAETTRVVEVAGPD